MASFKLTRNSSSSLSRSPTIQSGIDSLSCLEEGVISSGSTRIDRIWQEELARKHSAESSLHMRMESPHSHRHGIEIHEENVSPDHEGVRPNHENGRPIHIDVHPNHEDGRANRENVRPKQESFRPNHPRIIPIWVHTQRFKPRILLPIVVVIIFPCVYFYAHSSPHHGHSNHLPLPFDGDGFDYFALVFFFSAVLISIRIAYPRLNIMYRIRSMFSQQQRRCFSIWWLKPVTSFLVSDKTDKRMYDRTSSVTWTIGSKGTSIRDGKMNDKLKNAREGVQVYSNGDVYEGEFHQGRCSGSGVYYFYMSGRYEGDWVDGKYDGYGVETWARGSRYRGQYRQGLREGYGVYRFYTGDVFSGEWSNGQSHGSGVQTCEDGSRYVGEFKWGVKHGHGYYHFRNGDTYAGEYFADKMHGYGVYQFSNGHRYEGAWHEGKRRGLGMYTFRNGEIQAGYWHAGILQTPSTQNPGQGAAVAVSHSKVLHAVQEARRAASKAYEIPHVDDRVNKAVAAANRAANAARVAAVKAVQNKVSGPASPP